MSTHPQKSWAKHEKELARIKGRIARYAANVLYFTVTKPDDYHARLNAELMAEDQRLLTILT